MLNSMNGKWQLPLSQNVSLFQLAAVIILILCVSCKSVSIPRNLKTNLEAYLSSDESYFKGILIVDEQKMDTLIKHNHHNYFIPASNVKIFTLYTGVTLLGSLTPAFKYELSNDTLYVQSTGSPTFLNPNLKDSTGYHFLRKFKNIALISNNYEGDKFMPGWAWEDYQYYFSPEITAFPIHRNVVQVFISDSLEVRPAYFKPNFTVADQQPTREPYSNLFSVDSQLTDTLQIPFITSEEVTVDLLQDILKTNVISSKRKLSNHNVLYGMPIDSLYKQMLWESDNFTAEQLMLSASSTLSDTLSFKKARDFILEKHLQNIENPPRWVDGSGLSRYNLFTPESFVTVLNMLREKVKEDRLFHLFPAWDADGTVQKPIQENNYFIHAKSGSMGNIYNLSGYLKTKSGKVLLFSLMNNNFRKPSREIRKEMYYLLKLLHENY